MVSYMAIYSATQLLSRRVPSGTPNLIKKPESLP